VTASTAFPPLVGVVCNCRDAEGFLAQAAGDKYVSAVLGAARSTPVLLPAVGDEAPLETLLDRLDGVLLTGGVSNVEPWRYSGPASREGVPHDTRRDGVALRLACSAVERGLPLLGICRGLQEMNVAFGGTLHQHLHEVPGRLDHRSLKDRPIEERYEPRHRLELARDGWLADLLGGRDVSVNTLHGQGVDRLGDGLTVEAWAEDGTVEALTVAGAPGFALGVQWHTEFRPDLYPVHARILGAFGDACRAYADRRG